MKKVLTVLLAVCLCFSLCACSSWLDGSYQSVRPHQDDRQEQLQETMTASSYRELLTLLSEMVENGQQEGVINMPGFAENQLKTLMDQAIAYTLEYHPIGAYAVDGITYDLGTAGGKPAFAVNISYLHSRTEILRIKKLNMETAQEMIWRALDDCEAGIVMRVSDYRDQDFALLVQNFAEAYPEYCMEIPQVSVVTYPQSGSDRVLELTFTYQTNRDALRSMQGYVKPVFEAAQLNVQGEETQSAKFALMYSFLMERNDYQLETSITPAYSLLRHGVGDSRAFAIVFAAMCTRADLECQTVTGTKDGAPWTWNIICEDGVYYHIDLLQETNEGKLTRLTEEDLQSYVWDYSAYPEAGGNTEEPMETEGQ